MDFYATIEAYLSTRVWSPYLVGIGIGKDVESAGDAIEDSAENNKSY